MREAGAKSSSVPPAKKRAIIKSLRRTSRKSKQSEPPRLGNARGRLPFGPIAPPAAKAPRRQGIFDGLTGFASAA